MKRTKASEKEKAWRRKNFALHANGEANQGVQYKIERRKRLAREQLREEVKAFTELMGRKKARKAIKEAQ